MSQLYLCVDCGGSKTSAVIAAHDGTIVGRAFGGPSNASPRPPRPSVEPVPLPPVGETPFAAAWFGVSGLDSPAAVAEVVPVLSKLLGIPEGPRLSVANDTILLAAPVRMHPDIKYAVGVIGGTGSIAVGFEETENGFAELGRVGGWGWILGDEGGGFHVGREAVRQMVQATDAASVTGNPPPPSVLTTKILERFQIKTVLDILAAVHVPDPNPSVVNPQKLPQFTMLREKRLSSLAPLVFEAAFEHGDPLALSVLKTTSDAFAAQISLILGDKDAEKPKLVKAQDAVISFGGSLVGIEAYRKLILDALASRGHVFRYVEFVDDAAATGAIGLASSFKAS
ncbi:BcrAD-BadFG domain-containing protein [Mycena kentingensis (nom. inval.)]|nr:BcrAD-BadFG domain-containing protein [Mycena kentingensis (nom. inval.)]